MFHKSNQIGPSMSEATAKRMGSAPVISQSKSTTAIKLAAQFWYCVAAAGLLLFGLYIVKFYGGSALRGDFTAWGKVMPRGVIPGDTTGNATISAHLLVAAIITLGGLLQLIPNLRTVAPRFHRWNGRLFVVGAVIASLSGFYLIWVRGTVGSTGSQLGTTFNGVLILICAFMTVKHARAGELAIHRRWALRLFLLVNGVWFFRVGLFLWLMIHQKPVGFDPDTFRGPFLVALAWSQSLVPLAVLELYLRARAGTSNVARWSVAVVLFIATIGMGAGIVGAFMGLWLPRMG
jgi:uncharacterized membrane protein